MSFDDPSAFKGWLEQNGPIESIEAAICDRNGIMRGKRVPVEQASKVLGGGIRMPLSIVGVDVWARTSSAANWYSRPAIATAFAASLGEGPCRSRSVRSLPRFSIPCSAR